MTARYIEIINLLRDKCLIDDNIPERLYELDEDDFLKDLLDYISVEPAMDIRVNINDIDQLSDNVKKQILYNTLHLGSPEWFISNIDELIEYGEFYYINSPCSSYNTDLKTLIMTTFEDLIREITPVRQVNHRNYDDDEEDE